MIKRILHPWSFHIKFIKLAKGPTKSVRASISVTISHISPPSEPPGEIMSFGVSPGFHFKNKSLPFICEHVLFLDVVPPIKQKLVLGIYEHESQPANPDEFIYSSKWEP